MKFIHTSDWHIGRQFHNVSLLEDQRHVLEQIIEHIEHEKVDAVVIAGDIYDRSVPPASAVELLDEVLNRICNDIGVPVLIIPGNHDSGERLRFGYRQLCKAELYILGDLDHIQQPVKITGNSVEVDFYGIPYNDPESVRNHFGVNVASYQEAHSYLAAQILSTKSTIRPSVLLSHCFIDGCDESDSERPLSVGGADRISADTFKDFDYVALGHLHGTQYKSAEHIRYSGSILKYSFSEQNQVKGVNLIEMDNHGMHSIRQLPLNPLHDMRILEGELEQLLEQGKTDPHKDDYLLIRLVDKHALLDPMSKLRDVYPNVLHLEKPGFLSMSDQIIQRDNLKRNELDMFRDFFTQIHGHPLSPEQDQAMTTIISQLHQVSGEQA
jgi:exonuclease SbcD